MDLSPFLRDDFDHKQWINNALKDFKEPEDIESNTSKLILKLQTCSQEVNQGIEETCHQAMQIVPRVLREMGSVSNELTLLQSQMASVKEEIEQVEVNTSKSMRTLQSVDSLITRLRSVEKSLREADSWTSLSSDLEDVLESGDVDKICEKILGLQQALVMLTSVADYSSRVKRVEELRTHLEQLVSPLCVQAFIQGDKVGARHYVHLLQKVDRGAQAEKYYLAWMKTQVKEYWKVSRESTDWRYPSEVLDTFYEKIGILWSQEMKSPVFHDSSCRLASMSLTESLQSVSQFISGFMSECCKDLDTPLAKLELMTECIRTVRNFSSKVEDSLLESNPNFLNEDLCLTLSVAIFSPFQGICEVYFQLEKEHLLQHLASIPLDDPSIPDSIELMNQSVWKVFAAAEGAVERCFTLTSGLALQHMLESVRLYVSKYLGEVQRVCMNIREKCRQSNVVVHGMNAPHSPNSPTQRTFDAWQDSLDGDHNFLQTGIRLTAVYGAISLRLNEHFMPKMLNMLIFELQALPKQNQRSPFHRTEKLLLAPSSRTGEEPLPEVAAWRQLCGQLLSGATPTAFQQLRDLVHSQCAQLHGQVLQGVLQPLQSQLSQALDAQESTHLWASQPASGEELPHFAYTPLEYVTKLGQFILQLPQQLEPFLSHGDLWSASGVETGAGTSSSLDCGIQEALGRGGGAEELLGKDQEAQGVAVWLEAIVQALCRFMVPDGWCRGIHCLSLHGSKQLLCDVSYLVNVLEDLELHIPQELHELRTILPMTEEELREYAASSVAGGSGETSGSALAGWCLKVKEFRDGSAGMALK